MTEGQCGREFNEGDRMQCYKGIMEQERLNWGRGRGHNATKITPWNKFISNLLLEMNAAFDEGSFSHLKMSREPAV